MTVLSVNVNKIAWLRNARDGSRPDLVDCARALIEAGAEGITVHPRPDQRHIRPDDVHALAAMLQEHGDVEFNIEGNPLAGPRDNGYPGFDRLVRETRPDQCTLVPDDDHQLTSDHGWDLTDADAFAQISTLAKRYQYLGLRVSLFMDPVVEQIERAGDAGVDRIELYTGPYAHLAEQFGTSDERTAESWERYRLAAARARELGLGVNAGHDLNLDNLTHFTTIEGIAEVSIGHALVADALDMGLAQTVARYLDALAHTRPSHT